MAKERTINMLKSQVIFKDYSRDAERTVLVSGENLAHSLGKIARWYTDISWNGHTHTVANITDFPTLGTAAAKNVPASGNAGNDEVVLGSDSRLSDARTPTAHTHSVSDISDFPTLGTAAGYNVPASGDAGDSEVVLGNDSRLSDARTPTAHTHTEADISDLGPYAEGATHNGAAVSANKLNLAADVGSETKPVYFSYLSGKPVACTYSLNASVPANAVFTDVNVKQSPSTANESREVLFAGSTGNTEKTEGVGKGTKLTFNPSTGALTATSFSGSMAASNLTGTIDAGRLPETAVVANSYGPAAGGTLDHGDTFTVPYLTVDKYGRLTAASTKTFTLPAQYVHPTYTEKTSGLYKITVDATGHVSATAAVTGSDLPSHSHTLSMATSTGSSSITLAANTKYQLTAGGSTYIFTTPSDTVYTHPTYTEKTNGLYKITVDSLGHVSGTAAVTASDLPSHTHPYLPDTTKYAGSSSAGGAATSANKLNTNAGANITPVYFSNGVPVACKQDASGAHFSIVPCVESNGVMEIGRYIDFHSTNASTADYTYRFDNSGNGSFTLTSNTNNVLKLYSANGYNQIAFQTAASNKAYTAAGIVVNPLTTSGSVMRIESDGNMIVGAGESPSTLYSNDYDSCASSEQERLYLSADDSIVFITGADTYANRKEVILDASGNFRIGPNQCIIQTQNSTSNYTELVQWWKGGTNPGNYGPSIGHHNTGDTDGAIILLPYHTSTTPWSCDVGLYISKTRLWYNGTAISLNGHTHNYAGSSSAGGAATSANKLNTNAGSSTSPVYFSSGVPVACSYALQRHVYADYSVNSGNTHNYPYHLLCSMKDTTAGYKDFYAVFRVTAGYDGQVSGVYQLTVRMNNGSNSSANLRLISGWPYLGDFGKVVMGYNISGTNTYAYVFLVCGNWARTTVRIIQISSGITFYSSTEADNTTSSDPKTSVNVYASLAAAGSALVGGNFAYTQTTLTLNNMASNMFGIYKNSVAVPTASIGTGMIGYFYNVDNNTGNMPKTNNANAILQLNRHVGEYDSQLGFSSNGNIYYRYNNGAITSSTPWRQLAWNDEKIGAKSDGSYYGMTSPTLADNVWIRTTSLGIIPYQSGGAGSGHQSLGTSSWYFSAAYIDTVYGSLSGRASEASNCVCTYFSTTEYATNVSYAMLFAADPTITEVNSLRKTDDIRVNYFLGAANTEGLVELVLGNATAKSSANNASGHLTLYNANGKYAEIYPGSNSANINLTLPSSAGTLALVGDNNHTHSYIPLSGSTAITGELVTTSQNGYRLVSNKYGAIIRNDGGSWWFLVTAQQSSDAAAKTAGWANSSSLVNNSHPLRIQLSDGRVYINGYTIDKSVPSNAVFTDNNTTYTIATGDSNGQIKVTPSSGSAYNVSVKGLGSAAYTASTAYAAASHDHGRIVKNDTITYGASQLQWFDLSGTGTVSASTKYNPSNDWYHHIMLNHGNANGYYVDLAICFHADAFYYKRIVSGSIANASRNNGWVRILDEFNYGSYVTPNGIGAAPSSHTHSYAGSTTVGGDALTSLSLRLTHDNEVNCSKVSASYSNIWFFYRWSDGSTEDSSGSKYIDSIWFGNGNGAGTNTSVGKFANLVFNNINQGTLRHGGSASSWWNDRNAAMIYQTDKTANYLPIWGCRTNSDGSWCCGNHNGDNLYFNFISKSVYDSGANPTYYRQIYFTSDAKIEARGYNVINNGSGRLLIDYSGITMYNSRSGGWANGIDMYNSQNTLVSSLGFYGVDNTLQYTYIGGSYAIPLLKIAPSTAVTTITGTEPYLYIVSSNHTNSGIILQRGTTSDTYTDYRIINHAGDFKIQSNVESDVHADWFNMMTIAYSTGDTTVKGSLQSGGHVIVPEGYSIKLRPNHSGYYAGIGYDTVGNECIAIWAKNTVTRLRWHAGIDMSSSTYNQMISLTSPDFEISKASGTPLGYIGGYQIARVKKLFGGSTTITAGKEKTAITLVENVSPYGFVAIRFYYSGSPAGYCETLVSSYNNNWMSGVFAVNPGGGSPGTYNACKTLGVYVNDAGQMTFNCDANLIIYNVTGYCEG